MFVATECVRVVVDRAAAETYCTPVGDGSTAAEALARRAQDLHRDPPRYKGNFLCGIDGYPKAPECGDDPPNPYWSVWYWREGKWVYSSLGVADLRVEDRDKDGHPDPLGFRFHDADAKAAPRANPGYPTPAPSRPTTTRPPAQPTVRPASNRPAPVFSSAPASPPTSVTASRGTATPGSASPSGEDAATPSPTDQPPVADPARRDDDGVPVGTFAGAALAVALMGAAALRFRRRP